MASIRWDTELMTNYIPATAVPRSSKFVTCLDPITRKPIVLAISSDQKLNAIKEDNDGHPQLVNLGKMLGIADDRAVVAFDCQQAANLTIYLCVAVKRDAVSSDILVFKPFQWTPDVSFKLLPIQAANAVQNIYMGCPDAVGQSYPPILLTTASKDQLSKRSDITRILVDPYVSSFTFLRDMELPLDPEKILDIAPAANAFGRGLYALCQFPGGSRQIIGEFTRYDTDQNDGSLYWYNVALTTPAGASRIATFTDSRGRSCLLVGCTAGLQLFTPAQATSKYQPGTLITPNVLFKESTSLKVAQDHDMVTVWSVSPVRGDGSGGDLGYVRSTSDALKNGDQLFPVSVLPKGQVSGFSACVSNPIQDHVSQTLVTNDQDGNLSLLQQYTDTGLWRAKPFYYASTTTNIEVPSYNLSIHALDGTGQPVVQGTMVLTSSSYVDIMVNGKPITLTPSGAPFDLDGSGELAVIVATASVASQTFTVTSVNSRTGQALAIQPVTIDPSLKVIDTFKTAGDLHKAVTKQGVPLMNYVVGVVEDDIQKVGGLFLQLLSEKDAVKSAAQRSNLPPLQKKFAEAWHWVKQKASEAVQWGLQRINGVLNFICTIAGDVVQFVLDTVEKIGEAFQWLWQKIKLGIDKLIEFAGFLFSWSDIIATKNTIVILTNSIMDCGINGMGAVQARVDKMFDNLQSRVGAPSSQQVTSDNTGNKKSDNSIMDSPPVKWITERFKNGGAGDKTQIVADKAENADSDMLAVAENELQTAFNAVTGTIKDISTSITDAFNGSGKASAGDLINRIKGDVVRNMVSALRTAVGGFLKVVTKILQYLRDLGNFKIEMPIFTALYRKLVGNDPTLLDIVSLLIAVPMTIITKLITGKAPPTLPQNLDPRVVKFMFAYNSQYLMTPTAADVASSPDATNIMASRAAMNRMVAGSDPTPEDRSAIAWVLGVSADAIRDEIVAGIKIFVTILPTIVAGITVAVALILPVVGVVQSIRASLAAAKMGPPGPKKDQANEAFVAAWRPAKTSRYLGIIFPFLGSIATCVFPHPELPGVAPRLMSACTTLTASGFQAIFSKLGDVNASSKYEEMYQFLNIMAKTINFGLYCDVYSQELDAQGWSGHDQDCSGLGVSGVTLNFISDVAGFATFQLLKDGQIELGAAGIAVQGGAGFLSAIMQLARYTLQVDRKYLPTYMIS